MAVYKVNVSLPPELVARIDAAAAIEGRDAQCASSPRLARATLPSSEAFSAEERRRADIDHAIADMQERGKTDSARTSTT